MVKAELSYNPYLLETKVRFNGQAPRINSLVEKYDQSMLQTFNDFMNNKWYDLNQDAYWYDSHKSKENIYAGYWCWLAAAVLKMVGMTSEGKYIPRDLI